MHFVHIMQFITYHLFEDSFSIYGQKPGCKSFKHLIACININIPIMQLLQLNTNVILSIETVQCLFAAAHNKTISYTSAWHK